MRGNFPMVTGVLKGLLHSGFRYLNQMADKFTGAKVMKVPKFVMPATNSMLPNRTKEAAKTIAVVIATHGGSPPVRYL